MKRISLGSWCVTIGPYEKNPVAWDVVLSELKRLNFDGVELGGFAPHPNPDDMPEKEPRDALVQQMKDVGLGWSAHVPNLWGEKLLNTDDNSGYLANFRKNLQFCVDVGIPAIRVDCVQPPTMLEEIGEDTARKRVVETWKTCAQESADSGVRLTWEFEPGFAFNKPSDVFRILDEVDHDNFGVMLDTCHAHMVAAVGARQPGAKEILPGGALEFIEKLSGKINHIHLIDSDGTLHGDETSTHAPFGDGTLDFDVLVPALNKAGCPHDWWTIDLCFWAEAWDVAERCKKSVDELNAKYGG